MFIKTCFILCCFIIVKGCSNKMKLEKDINFEIESAEYQTIISGVKGGGSFTKIFLKLNKIGSISIDGIYYKKKYAELKNEKNNFSAQFKDTLNNEGLFPVNENTSQKEDEISTTSDLEFNLQLKIDEAVLYYTEKGKKKYYKLKLTKKTFNQNDIPM